MISTSSKLSPAKASAGKGVADAVGVKLGVTVWVGVGVTDGVTVAVAVIVEDAVTVGEAVGKGVGVGGAPLQAETSKSNSANIDKKKRMVIFSTRSRSHAFGPF